MGRPINEMKISLHNEFSIEVIDAKTKKIKQTAKAFNVVCNGAWTNMFDFYMSGNSRYSRWTAGYIFYGSGTGTPSANDTDLFHYEGYVQTSDSAYGAYERYDTTQESEGIIKRIFCRVMTESQENGKTITELGLGRSYSGNDRTPIYTHAMLQDMNGNPISIVKTNTDIIKIISTTYLHFNQNSDIHMSAGFRPSVADNAGQNFLRNLAMFNFQIAYYGYVGCLSKPVLWGGSGSAVKNDFTLNIDSQNKTLTISAHRFDTTRNIGGGAAYVCFWERQSGSYSSSHDEPLMMIKAGGTIIPPQNITGEIVGTGDGSTKKFKTLLDFPRNAKVYLNGVEVQSGVTVHNWPIGTDSTRYLEPRYDDNIDMPMFFYPVMDGYRTGVYCSLASEIGIARIECSWSNVINKVWISDDGENWTQVVGSTIQTGGYSFTGAQQHAKFYKFDLSAPPTGSYPIRVSGVSYDGYNIEFDTPPANGDIITVDYSTDYLPKDSDHVLDVTLSFTMGDWTGE